MKKFLLVTVCLVSLLLHSRPVLAQTAIVGTDWVGSGLSTGVATDPSTFTTVPASVIPGSAAVLVSQWNRNNIGGTVTTTSNCYDCNNWVVGGSLATAQAAAQYIYFTVTNDANTEVEITNILLQSQISTTGPTSVQFCYSIGAGSDVIFGPSTTGSTGSAIVLNFPGIAHICAGQTAKFKLYGWNAGSTGGTIRINDNSGLTATFVQPPVGAFAFSSSPVCSGSGISLDFNSLPSGGLAPYSYSWSGPSGFSSTLANPSILTPSVTNSGTYSLTVTDAYTCASTATTAATVTAGPDTTMTLSGPLSFCLPGSITLSVPSVAGYIYQWYSASAGALAAFTNSYTTSTSDSYWCVITNPTGGCSATSNTYTVVAATTPTPSITPGFPGTICAGTALTLSTTASAGYSYQWYDGASPIAGATNSTYLAGTTAGSFSYTVKVTIGSCSATSAVRTLTVNAAPAATVVTPGPSITICAGANNTLTSTTEAGVTYQWYKGFTPVAGATNATYNANTTGAYTMRVTSTSGGGCTATSNSVNVTVNAVPIATITPSGAVSVCTGSTQVLSGTAGVGQTYQWYQDFVPIAGATNLTYTASTPGSYKLVVTKTATGCYDSSATAAVITLNPVPTAPATAASGLTTFCSGNSVTLTAGAVPGGTTYQWNRSGTNIAGATNATYVASVAGSYSVIVINAFNCKDTSTPPIVVTVNASPSSTVGLVGTTTFCTGSSLIMNAAVLPGYTYQWYDNSGLIPGATTSSYTESHSNRDSVVITSAAGCVTTTAATVTNEILTPMITYPGSTSFCTGNSLLLTVNATGPGITYQWKKNTVNIPGANSSSYAVNTPGIYTCYVNISGSCATTTAPVLVTVFLATTPLVTFDGVNVSTGNFYATYQWFINSVTIPGATNYSTPAYTNASYRVMVTDTNGCVLSSAEKNVYNVGVQDVNAVNSISIYPNPATTSIHIESPVEVIVAITTIEGKEVLQGTSRNEMDLTTLPSGLYMVIISDERRNRIRVEKLVKQ